ncbi:PKD domain-containing protein [Methanoregula sp. PtaU1.Bin006]|uniref:PKD domain-containing protein n=1 Tax=Methanoregula sp. PtaU1.Bin006 TaxID=1811681 RepID=UPI0025ECDC41|nr:PKD domain-containing protein [Methanoregula sp. PtaU1.Bin006]
MPNLTLEVTPEITPAETPDISIDDIAEVIPDTIPEKIPETTTDLFTAEILSADDLPALDAEDGSLEANYTQNRTSGPVPLAIRFYDRSSGTVTNWSWDFGDGETSDLKNPVHTFASAGTYTVRLTVSDGIISDTYEVIDRIRADTPEAPVAAISANKTSWSSPAVVQFYDRSTGYPTSWAWDFGDGTTSNVKNPVHTYESTGNYTITLIVTNNLGTDTITKDEYFHAYDPSSPVAALSANKTSWSSPAVVQFYDRSTGFPTSWSWDFGDGTTANVKNPVHTYAATGNYTVTLTVTNDLGTDTITKDEYFHAYDPSSPVAALSANKTSWSSPAVVQFYDRSTGFPTSWSWDFGDGTTANVKNPVHTYAATGNYTVTLTVTNDLGTDTITKDEYFHAYDPSSPVAALSANKTSWSSPAVVQFYDRSTGFPTSWSWDFGDGETANVKNPVHTYTAAGNYTVTLTVTNDLGTDTITQTEYFHTYDPRAPAAAISANKTAWSAPAVIQFYDRSTGFPTSWAWDFGDGETANVKNPVHTYAATGNYTITLTVINDLGSDTKTATDYIIVSGSSAPVAAISANKTSWSAPAAIQFYDRSAGFPTSWTWDFGDGTTSNLKNPVHTYTATGNYTVNLTVTNEVGSDTKVAVDYIKISNSAAPVAAISANKTSWSAPAAIQFYDRSTGFPTEWLWDFGDGNTSTLKNPVHTYTGTGNYTVTLTVSNDLGSDTAVQTDYIKTSLPEAPAASLSANRTSGTAPVAIQFYDRSAGFPTAWVWDFGDGTTASVRNPVHTYMTAGNYTVSLIATNDLGSNTTTRADYIRLTGTPAPLPVPYIWFDPGSGTAPLSVMFMGSSDGSPLSWNWSFGDGSFSDLQNLNHTYQDPGQYTVSLTVGYAGGTNTSTFPGVINVTVPEEPLAANFTGDVTEGPAPLTVNFTDISTGSPTSWNWSFGDGTFAEVQNPKHTYAAAGNYSVSLAVSNAGSSDSRTRTDYIAALPSGPEFDAEIILNSMPTTMFQGEHYIVDIKVNNTGTETWYADPASTNLVYLQGLGGPSGNASQFNITHIPMIFQNETVAPGESYDFFFYVKAPDTIGTYTPEYQVSSASGTFGPVANATVNVIKNPFHPVLQPDGSKLYTTTFGNTSSGVSVNIVGPRVYIDDIKASSFDDPRFLINPALKSGVFNLELNESFNYADISIRYDPAKTTTPSNLALGYFNYTTGNYTFIPSTVDTTNHTVTSRVTPGDLAMRGSSIGALDPVQYHALPANAQNEMGYMDIGANDNWTIYPPVDSYATTSFANGASFPPGNYTILTSGSYTSYYVQYIGCVGWVTADSNPDNTYGYYVNFNNPAGGYKQVQKLRVASGTLKVDHKGGPISVYHSHIVNGVCGSVGYRLYYGDGPVFRDGEYDFRNELNNDKFNVTELGYDVAVTAYQAAAGCVLGQAGQKGGYLDSVHSAIPGWSSAINDDVTESTAYMVGQIACNVLFPEVTLARDFTADVLRGDPVAVVLDSTGFLGPMRAYLGSSNIIPAFIAKVPQEVNAGNRIMSDLWRQGIYHTELPAIQKVAMLDKAFDGAATRLSGQGVADDVIAAVYENNGNIVKTLKAGERSGTTKVFWLEEGKLGSAEGATTWVRDNGGSGWAHIKNNHYDKDDFKNAFGSSYESEESVQNLILDCTKNGINDPSDTVVYYKKITDTNVIKVVTGDNGYIRTSYPLPLSDLPENIRILL